ncbi:hypothetical protein GMMP1_460028 [Candidatus Magnetomoraceae bacterium gMMP-1]
MKYHDIKITYIMRTIENLLSSQVSNKSAVKLKEKQLIY